MRKVLFIAGMILLLAGLALARPGDTRNMIDGVGNRDIHDMLMSTFNGSHERSSDGLGDNLEVGCYGVVMIGIIMMVLSVAGKKDTANHLLYAGGDKQNISPRELEKCITNPTMTPEPANLPPGTAPGMAPTPSGPGKEPPGGGFELPDIEASPQPSPLMVAPRAPGSNLVEYMSASVNAPHGTSMEDPYPGNLYGNSHGTVSMGARFPPSGGKDIPPSPPTARTMIPGMYDPGMTVPPMRTRNFDPMSGEPLQPGFTRSRPPGPHDHHPMNQNAECTLRCPNCNQDFTLRGNIREVICPRCGKRFMNRDPVRSR